NSTTVPATDPAIAPIAPASVPAGDLATASTSDPATEPVAARTPRVPGRPTDFLALDKCLPRRQFLEIIEVDVPEDHADHPLQLEYDPEWLAILRLTTRHLPLSESPFQLPADVCSTGTLDLPLLPDSAISRETEWVNRNVVVNGRAPIPCNFVPMAPVPEPGTPDSAHFGLATRGHNGRIFPSSRGRRGYYGGNPYDSQPWQGRRPDVLYPNPQTDELCKMLDIDDPITQRT
ncbi:lariat debranching enzyme, partial [Linderina pennispora]